MPKLALLVLVFMLCSCKENPPHYNGYIDADLIFLSSNYPGRLSHLLVKRGQPVEKNQLLFKLEQTSENYGIDISQFTQKSLSAQREAIINQIQYDEINYRRTLRMKAQDVASQNDLELAKKDLDVLKNQLSAIDFQIKSNQIDTINKKWQMQRKENHATDSGIIFDTYFTEDEYIQPGQPVLALITKSNIKVIFFVPEMDLSKIPLNSHIQISRDGEPDLIPATINYISQVAQFTPPIIYSREDRKTLLFRVEARIDNPDLNKLHLGQPVTLELVL